MAEISTEEIRKAIASPRFAALSQTGLAIGDLRHYDQLLVREARLLVPVDVQALVVRDGDEPMVRLGFRAPTDIPPNVADPGDKRPGGVHLWWRTPRAFGRGKIVDDPLAPGDATRRLLQLPLLPDRWVVVRIVVPVGAVQPLVRGWVVEADNATVTPLEEYPVRTNTVVVGQPVPPDRLNVHVGGANWTATYDASIGRLALHDPLNDLDQAAPNGIVGDAISYVVAGWWADPRHDPLDGVGSLSGYAARLRELGWDDPDHPDLAGPVAQRKSSSRAVADRFGIKQAERHTTAGVRGQPLVMASSSFVNDAIVAAVAPPPPARTTMLHGRIHGVPFRSTNRPDDRPSGATVRLALGPTSPSVAALLSSGGLAPANPATPAAGSLAQRNAERLLGAFAMGRLDRLDSSDVWADVEAGEHALGFAAEPGGVEAVDHLVDRGSSGTDPGSAFRRGRRTKYQRSKIDLASSILWSSEKVAPIAFTKKLNRSALRASQTLVATQLAKTATTSGAGAEGLSTADVVRDVERPAPPYHRPVSPVLAIVGGGRSIQASERDEADGVLRVRTSDQSVRRLRGLFETSDLLRSVGSGAIPDEALTVVREALGEDPFLVSWRTQRAAGGRDRATSRAVGLRLSAEAALNHAYYSGDDGRLSKLIGVTIDSAAERQTAVEGLLKHSWGEGVWSHPEGVTMWGQPWRPLFCDWEIELDLANDGQLNSWLLGEIDLDRLEAFSGGAVTLISGRSPLVDGTANGMFAAVERWMEREQARNAGGHGLASSKVRAASPAARRHLAEVDVVSATLDGIRETLLGLAYDRGVVRAAGTEGDDGAQRALAVALPRLVAAGRLRLTQARLVDAFGRTLNLPVSTAAVVARNADRNVPAAMLFRPRITTPARIHLRLVDPLALTGAAATAFVDQAVPTRQVNPVAGFLLPDHIDEALEMFDTSGRPLGQLAHDGFSDAVFWEGAPGRVDIGPAAGPTDDPDPTRARLGWIAAAVVAADATARQGSPTRPESESPLSAMLRAIDTTLWTIDPLGAMGREHIAGLVGRPIAVVCAELTLDVPPDADRYVYQTPRTPAERIAVLAELASVPFEIRLGSLTRTDDGLLGYFVDDDYSRFCVVDRAIVEQARDAGRSRGHLGLDGTAPQRPITHQYVVPDGTVTIRYGQTLRLTLLMHPGGKVHFTSGILPRSSVALSRDWVQPGLSAIAPSVRCGPLLIDADKVRLPKIAAFPADQLFTRRDAPGTWRDDPILSATQYAFLPDQASEVQEGWIRINPNPAPNEGAT